jgi:hypothetical protein
VTAAARVAFIAGGVKKRKAERWPLADPRVKTKAGSRRCRGRPGILAMSWSFIRATLWRRFIAGAAVAVLPCSPAVLSAPPATLVKQADSLIDARGMTLALNAILEAYFAHRSEVFAQGDSQLLSVETDRMAADLRALDAQISQIRAEAQILDPAHAAFVERAENVVVLGPCKVGKRHTALVTAHSSASAEYKVRVVTIADQLLQLAASRSRAGLEEYFERPELGPSLRLLKKHGCLPKFVKLPKACRKISKLDENLEKLLIIPSVMKITAA